MTREPKLLRRYLVDRAAGATLATGPAQLVVLVLVADDGSELAVAMSKVDAVQMAAQLQGASLELRLT